MKYGITRMRIISEDKYWKSERNLKADLGEKYANDVYCELFNLVQNPLVNNNVNYIECSHSEARAKHDYKDGYDVILQNTNGVFTLQEKILTTNFNTLTVEEKKSSGADGFWYHACPQLYFVAYAPNQKNGDNVFTDWMVVDYVRLKMDKSINWEYNQNQTEGRRAIFRYVKFDDIPQHCVVARKNKPVDPSFDWEQLGEMT